MIKVASNFPEHGMDLMREFLEQSVNQTAAMFEGFLKTARSTADSFDQQSSQLRERSMTLASETLSNATNFAHKVMRAREPQELIQLQSEFMSQQAHALAEQSRLMSESFARGANEAAKMSSQGLAEVSRKKSQAA
jgi:phasin family protein